MDTISLWHHGCLGGGASSFQMYVKPSWIRTQNAVIIMISAMLKCLCGKPIAELVEGTPSSARYYYGRQAGRDNLLRDVNRWDSVEPIVIADNLHHCCVSREPTNLAYSATRPMFAPAKREQNSATSRLCLLVVWGSQWQLVACETLLEVIEHIFLAYSLHSVIHYQNLWQATATIQKL